MQRWGILKDPTVAHVSHCTRDWADLALASPVLMAKKHAQDGYTAYTTTQIEDVMKMFKDWKKH